MSVPRPAAAPARQRVAAQTGMELRLTLRNGESLLVAFGIPLGLLVFFSVVDVLPTDGERPVDFLVPGVLALSVMSTSLVALGIATGFERFYLVLKRLGATPLRRRELILAKVLAVAAVQVVQIAVVLAVAVLLLGYRPGGRLVAQCGGKGNIAGQLAAADAVAARPEFAAAFRGWERPHRFAGAEETAAKLEAAGFAQVACWLQPNPVQPDEPRAYLRTVTLGAHLDQLPPDRHDPFLDQVLALLPVPVTVDYVRLNIDATRPAAAG
jgi:hypothetical protein